MVRMMRKNMAAEGGERQAYHGLVKHSSILMQCRSSDAQEELSSREQEILRLVVEGKDNATIAQELFISPYAVKNHISKILLKLNVTNRIQAAVLAVRDLPPCPLRSNWERRLRLILQGGSIGPPARGEAARQDARRWTARGPRTPPFGRWLWPPAWPRAWLPVTGQRVPAQSASMDPSTLCGGSPVGLRGARCSAAPGDPSV